jgi:hypothetical protein
MQAAPGKRKRAPREEEEPIRTASAAAQWLLSRGFSNERRQCFVEFYRLHPDRRPAQLLASADPSLPARIAPNGQQMRTITEERRGMRDCLPLWRPADLLAFVATCQRNRKLDAETHAALLASRREQQQERERELERRKRHLAYAEAATAREVEAGLSMLCSAHELVAVARLADGAPLSFAVLRRGTWEGVPWSISAAVVPRDVFLLLDPERGAQRWTPARPWKLSAPDSGAVLLEPHKTQMLVYGKIMQMRAATHPATQEAFSHASVTWMAGLCKLPSMPGLAVLCVDLCATVLRDALHAPQPVGAHARPPRPEWPVELVGCIAEYANDPPWVFSTHTCYSGIL